MQAKPHQRRNPAAHEAHEVLSSGNSPYPPLEDVTRPNLTTKEVAYYTNMSEQTWREYACYETGPIKPVRVCNRLNWPTKAVKQLCGVS